MAHETLRLDAFGIELTWAAGGDRRNATLTSEIPRAGEADIGDEAYNGALDGLEGMILACFCAGIDVNSPAYLEAIETALDGIENNLG